MELFLIIELINCVLLNKINIVILTLDYVKMGTEDCSLYAPNKTDPFHIGNTYGGIPTNLVSINIRTLKQWF